MKRLGFLAITVLLIASIGLADQNDRVVIRKELKVLGSLEPELSMLATGDKEKLMLYNVFPISSADGVTLDVFHNISLSMAKDYGISFAVELGGLKATEAQVHYVFTGPEFFTESSDWFDVNKNFYYFYYYDLLGSWKKGVYTLTVIAEEDNGASGAGCVVTCRFRIY